MDGEHFLFARLSKTAKEFVKSRAKERKMSIKNYLLSLLKADGYKLEVDDL